MCWRNCGHNPFHHRPEHHEWHRHHFGHGPHACPVRDNCVTSQSSTCSINGCSDTVSRTISV